MRNTAKLILKSANGTGKIKREKYKYPQVDCNGPNGWI
jgi:hypothetical protein